MNKCYYRIEWKNYPSDETPLNEQNLNKIDVAADEMDNRIISLDSTKCDKSEAQLLVKYIEYDEDTGIFKITHYNGASYTIDTLLEKLAVNFDYDYQTQQLIIELSDGEIKYVDLSALITHYEFLDSETVDFSVDNGGEVTAIVKEGSIKEEHLRPDYLADIKVESAKAEASKNMSEKSAGEAADSAKEAKEYAEQLQEIYENFQQAGTVTGVKGNAETSYRGGNVNLTPENIGALPSSGGTITGNLRLKGNGNYGNKLNFGDGDYVHMYEYEDDKLEIKASTLKLEGTSKIYATRPIDGDITGNAASATKLATARDIRTNLSTTAATRFDGSADINPGVYGTLPLAYGGTGATTAENARKNLGVFSYFKRSETVNLDNLKEPGVYTISNEDNYGAEVEIINAPKGVYNNYGPPLIVFDPSQYDHTFIQQILIVADGANIYFRFMDGDYWREWYKLGMTRA